jgi:hypothetical protein
MCLLLPSLALSDTENCIPNIVVLFEDPNAVIVSSTKDLSNIVIVDCEGNHTKFDDLNVGKTGSFTTGKEINIVYVKSGCNQSGDGPGYGEKFERECSCEEDCAGVPCGESYLNECGICVPGDYCQDENCEMDVDGKTIISDPEFCVTPSPSPSPSPTPECEEECCDDTCVNETPTPTPTPECPSGYYDKCGTCDGTNECLDCADVPFGGADIDPCGVCAGDGSSCRECNGDTIFEEQIKLDSNSMYQARIIKKLSKQLPSTYKNLVVKFAHELHLRNWGLVWILRSFQINECTNEFKCETVSNESVLRDYLENSKELKKLAKKTFRKGKKSRLRKRLFRKARKLHNQNKKLIKTIPKESLDCL